MILSLNLLKLKTVESFTYRSRHNNDKHICSNVCVYQRSFRVAKPYRLLLIWNLLMTFFDSRQCVTYSISVSLRMRGGYISVDWPVFVLLYNTNFKNKLKFNYFCINLKTKNNSLTAQFVFNLQNHPTFKTEERLVNLVGGRECFVCLSILLVYSKCVRVLIYRKFQHFDSYFAFCIV